MTENLPELEKSEVDKIVESFKHIYQNYLNLITARVRKIPNQKYVIASQWCQRNLERGKLVKMMRHSLTDLKSNSCVDIDTVDISHWILNSWSKSGKFRAIIRSASNDQSKAETEYLEIWSEQRLTATFDLNALDVHGPVYTDDRFSSIFWSPKEDRVIYIAEQKTPKTSSFYDQKSVDESTNDSNKTGRGEQFTYKENWGEIIGPKCQPVIVSCNITKKSISVLEGVPENISPGQIICTPDSDGVVGVGFINTPRKLGPLWCTNKKNHIFYLSYRGEYMILSDEKFTVHSPTFSPNGKYLMWFQRPQCGPTHDAHSIMRCDWNTKEVHFIIDTFHDKILTENRKEFYGIYSAFWGRGFVSRCWTSDSKYVLFSTDQAYRASTFILNIENGKIWDIGFESETESTILLDVTEDDYALVNFTSFKRPPVLTFLHIPSVMKNPSNKSSILSLSKSNTVIDENIILNFVVSSGDEKIGEGDCFATYYGRQNDEPKSTPVIMYLHGGPHWTVPNVFHPELNFYVKSGFAVLITYYHGSSGFGQKFLKSLVGRIGSLEVADCFRALQTALYKFPWLDPNQVVVVGVSSGGFLAAHLSSLYPNEIKGSVMQNPVTDVYLRFFLTDIPDWAAVGLGFPYTGLADVVTNPQIYTKMMDVSPVKNIKNVKAPTLLLLGRNDIRVPIPIGLAYYHMLKELNVPTKVLLYDDIHLLSKVSIEMDCKINAIIWLKRCLKKSPNEKFSQM